VLVLAKYSAESETSADLFLALRCLSLEIITSFCFAKSVNAIDAPHFTHPLINGMHAATKGFGVLRSFPLFRKAVMAMPPRLAIILSPATAGTSRFQLALKKEVGEVIANPESLKNHPHPIIYHRLLDPAAQKGLPVPNQQSLLDEAQILMFAGSDTVSNVLMIGFFHLLQRPSIQKRLRDELLASWPELHNAPTFETLETLPLLTAVVKESLRISPNITTPCERIVPAAGAVISGVEIPAGAVVSMSALFVHNSAEIFRDPEAYDPDRWLAKDSKSLDQWLVAFSKGPRSCLGINLAWCELYIAFATLVRSLDMKIDGTVAEDLDWKDCFTPYFYGKHLRVWCQPVTA
jgi:cytochrome P450